MPQHLFAACQSDKGLIAKHIRLQANVQDGIERLFLQQEEEFREDIQTLVPFNGQWKPDPDEMLTLDVTEEAKVFVQTIDAPLLSIPNLNVAGFSNEGIKALFTGSSDKGSTKVLVQRFNASQMLQRRSVLLFDGNAFGRLSGTAFTMATALTCIIEGSRIFFKSQGNLRSIINLKEVYREATDAEVQAFASHGSLEINDVDGFKLDADQTTRKLIRAISINNILNKYGPLEIQKAAQSTTLNVAVQGGKIVVPSKRIEVKALLQFLNDDRFLGPLSGEVFITNSKRNA